SRARSSAGRSASADGRRSLQSAGRAMKRTSWFNVTSVALGLGFLYLPILLLIIYSFNESRLVTVWGGFSTKWYVSLLHNAALLDGGARAHHLLAVLRRRRRAVAPGQLRPQSRGSGDGPRLPAAEDLLRHHPDDHRARGRRRLDAGVHPFP